MTGFKPLLAMGMEESEAARVLGVVAAAGDDPVDIAEAALALSAYGDPEARLAPYRAHLEILADDVAKSAAGAASAADRAAALNAVLIERWGYRGDEATYDSLENADLRRVIDRRKGLPVALGILFMHAARRQGWPVAGLNFPGHFLLRIEAGASRAIVDPFHGGEVVTVDGLRRLVKAADGDLAELMPHHYQPVADREILLRLQNNLRTRLFRAGDLKRTAFVTETMILMAPSQTALWREAGLLYAELGEVAPAISALERFLGASANNPARHQAAALLQKLRSNVT
ncbi:MAG: transglutaminase-like domain-containing protein [Alphaproteobacteria bacterium]